MLSPTTTSGHFRYALIVMSSILLACSLESSALGQVQSNGQDASSFNFSSFDYRAGIFASCLGSMGYDPQSIESEKNSSITRTCLQRTESRTLTGPQNLLSEDFEVGFSLSCLTNNGYDANAVGLNQPSTVVATYCLCFIEEVRSATIQAGSTIKLPADLSPISKQCNKRLREIWGSPQQ